MPITVTCPIDGKVKQMPKMERIIIEWENYTETTYQVKEFLSLLGKRGREELGKLNWEQVKNGK